MVTQQPGSARMQVSGYFCTLTNPSDRLSARPGPDRSRDELFAQVRRPRICELCSRRSPAGSIAAFTTWTLTGKWTSPAPAVHRRAPLRLVKVPVVLLADPVCSRRSPAGSIAAGSCTTCRRRSSPCSRRSPAGSIAADQVRSAGDDRSGPAPAVHRRAPLRQYQLSAVSWLHAPCSRRSPAGSIAARVIMRGWGRWRRPAPAVHRRAPLRRAG